MLNKKCSICSYTFTHEDEKLQNKNKDVKICKNCIDLAFFRFNPNEKRIITNNNFLKEIEKNSHNILKQAKEKNPDFFTKEIGIDLNSLTPNLIHEKLNDYIVGQEETKKTISVSLYQHFKRIKSTENKNLNQDLLLKKSNILLLGDSGSGKTLFAETISKVFKIPMVIADATLLTAKGYVGNDVDEMLYQLITKSNNEVKEAQKGIIYIDEIDKISTYTKGEKNATTSSVQENLLKIIDGTTINLKVPTQMNTNNSIPTLEFDTSNILFIFGGAFSGLEELMSNKKINTLGFKKEEEKQEDIQILDYLLDYGFSPEFLGRIPIISHLNKLTKEDLLKIIIEPKNSILKQYINFFKEEKIDIIFPEKSLKKLVERIHKNKVGARTLKKEFDSLFNDIIYNISDYKEKEITIPISFIETKDLSKLKVIPFTN